MNNYMTAAIWFTLLLSLCCSCGEDNAPATTASTHDEETGRAPTNRLDIPPLVRKNLGITFATAEYRAVADTIRVPGSLELLPSAMFHYSLPVSGRVSIHVKPLQAVEAGTLLMDIDAPDWRKLQAELNDSKAAIAAAQASVTRAQVTLAAATQLNPEKSDPADELNANQATVHSAEAGLLAATARYQHLLAEAASISGLNITALEEPKDGKALWQTLNKLPVRASHPAVIQEVHGSSGTWHEKGNEIIRAIQPHKLRFHGHALQADLTHLRDGQQVRIYPPSGHADSLASVVKGTLRVGISGNPQKRLINVYVDLEAGQTSPWLRPEIAAIADISTSVNPDAEQLAVPQRAVISDGLDKIMFRRNPRDPDQVIRIKADLGDNDGKWVVVKSGLAEGDEVVIDGIYELKLEHQQLNNGASAPEGFHVHADGTVHTGGDH